jgi:hypothetical protein
VLQQGVALARRSGLGQKSGGLVDDKNMMVLKEDVEFPRRGLGAGSMRAVRQRGPGFDVVTRLDATVAGHIDSAAPHRLLSGAP